MYNSGRSLHDTGFKHRLTGTSDSVRGLAVSDANQKMTVATADGATEFDKYGNVIHTFSIDDGSDLNTSILTNNINSVTYLNGETVFGYNITGGIEMIKRLTDLTGLLTYFDTSASDSANPDANTVDDGTHAVSTWSNDASVDYSWSAPNSNGTTYDYTVQTTDLDSNTSATGSNTSTLTTSITSYEVACNTDVTGTGGAATQTELTKTCDFADGSSNYMHVRSQDGAGNWSAWTHTGPYQIDTSIPTFGTACGGTVDYAGQTYNTLQVGDQCWFAENLNVGTMLPLSSWNPSNNATIEKWCLNNDPANCDTYGGFYNWDEAMGYTNTEGVQGICAPGWHIPTDAEQHTLDNYLATGTCDPNRTSWGCDPAATELKPGGSSDFNALLTGNRNLVGGYSYFNSRAYFWSSSESGTNPVSRYLHSTLPSVTRFMNIKEYGYSVRCLQDDVSLPIDEGKYKTDTSLTFTSTPSDVGSGLIDCNGQIDVNNTDGTGLVFDSTVGTDGDYTFTGTNGNTYYYRYQCTDVAGNTSAWSAWTDGILVDTTAPTLASQSTYTTDWYTSDQASTFTFTDTGSGSGIASGNDVACTITTEGATSTCTDTSVNVCDNAGNCNTTNATSNPIKLDKSAPTGGSVSHPNISQRDATITITVDAGADILSGLSTAAADYLLEVSIAPYNGSSCGTYTAFADANVLETTSATEYSYSNTAIDNCYKFRYSVSDTTAHEVTYLSSDITIILDNGLPGVITLDNYNDGSASTETSPTLQFDIPADPDGDLIKYQLQIDNNSDFSSPEVDFTQGDGDLVSGPIVNATYTPGGLTNAHHYWRVRAYDDHSGISDWTTATNGFVVDTILPTSKIQYPQNEASLKNVTSIRGKSTDAGTVSSTRISIYDKNAGKYYNGTDFTANTETWLTTTGSTV